jgi:hypothetical protein
MGSSFIAQMILALFSTVKESLFFLSTLICLPSTRSFRIAVFSRSALSRAAP